MSAEFGGLLTAAMQEQGLSQGKVAALVGVYGDGRYLDATQVRLLMTGQRHPIRELVERLIEVLDLPAEEAWHAAGLWPPDLDVAGYRRFRHYAGVAGVRGVHSGQVSPEKLVVAGQDPRVSPLPSDPELDLLIGRNRRPRLSPLSVVPALRRVA